MKIVRIFLLFLLAPCYFSTVDAEPAQTWKTGQTASYAAGDDGDLDRGVAWPSPRFVDNGDGTVTDYLTGLIWLKDASCAGEMSWDQALTYCNSLESGSCGLTDGSAKGTWRLPNIVELESLVNAGVSDLATWLNSQGFTGVPSANCWSATTRSYGPGNAWCVYMCDGYVSSYFKSSNYFYVWPVRAGQ